MTSSYCTLFGMPLFQNHIPPERYNKKQIIEDIQYNYNISKQRGVGFGKWHDSFECTDERFKKIESDNLVKIYTEEFKTFCGNYLKLNKDHSIKVEIINYTCNKEDAFMTPHAHPGADFSLVHYLQLPKNSSPIRFTNHNDFAYYFRSLRPALYDMVDNENYLNSWMFEHNSIQPVQDTILIFPAVMRHQVPYSKEIMKSARISVVANIMIKPAL